MVFVPVAVRQQHVLPVDGLLAALLLDQQLDHAEGHALVGGLAVLRGLDPGIAQRDADVVQGAVDLHVLGDDVPSGHGDVVQGLAVARGLRGGLGDLFDGLLGGLSGLLGSRLGFFGDLFDGLLGGLGDFLGGFGCFRRDVHLLAAAEQAQRHGAQQNDGQYAAQLQGLHG